MVLFLVNDGLHCLLSYRNESPKVAVFVFNLYCLYKIILFELNPE